MFFALPPFHFCRFTLIKTDEDKPVAPSVFLIIFSSVAGCVVVLLDETIPGPVLLIIAVADTKKTARRKLSVQRETYTDTCIIIIGIKLILIPLSRNLG